MHALHIIKQYSLLLRALLTKCFFHKQRIKKFDFNWFITWSSEKELTDSYLLSIPQKYVCTRIDSTL